VLAELGRVADPFDVICISGDTDCFLDPDAGLELVSMRVPNFSETSHRVPSAESRLGLLGQFAEAGMACLLALRPTFPFGLVGRDDVRIMVQRAARNTSAVLGEVMLLDADGHLAARMGVPQSSANDRRGQLTFWERGALDPAARIASDWPLAAPDPGVRSQRPPDFLSQPALTRLTLSKLYLS
jgi:hypothetical protein